MCIMTKSEKSFRYKLPTFASRSPLAPFLRTMNWAGLSAWIDPSGNCATSNKWASPTAGEMYTLKGESGICSSLNLRPILYSPITNRQVDFRKIYITHRMSFITKYKWIALSLINSYKMFNIVYTEESRAGSS